MMRLNAISKNKKVCEQKYYIYIIECVDTTLYTGITNDYNKRFKKHKNGVGAQYTKNHEPKKIVLLYETNTRSNALKLEYQIKQLSRKNKLMLIKNARVFKSFFQDSLDINLYKKVRIKYA